MSRTSAQRSGWKWNCGEDDLRRQATGAEDAAIELVAFLTADGLRLDGVFVEPRSDTVIVHVHGKCGNFYQNDFIKSMIQSYGDAGVGFLAFNHRGHDCIAEGYRGDRVEYIGGSVETFEDCILDIDAAVAFAGRYATRVVIQGHSNGSEKALFYGQRRASVPTGLVLISPSDSYAMQCQYRPEESPSSQANRLALIPEGTELQLLPLEEYGIMTGNKHYPIPITKKALLGLLTGSALRVLNLSEPWAGGAASSAPTLICLGGRDPYLTVAPDEMARQVAVRLSPRTSLYFDSRADHHFHGLESQLLEAIVRWWSDLGA